MYVFTERVELEDRAYRWYYDVKYKQDKTMNKGELAFCAVMAPFFAAIIFLVPEEKSMKWPVFWFLMVLTVYFILRGRFLNRYKYKQRGWTNRRRYELDEEKVKVLNDTRTTENMEKLGQVIKTVDFLSGGPYSEPDMTGEEAYTIFKLAKTTKVILDPAADLITLRRGITLCQLFVPAEDYDLVKDFILAHIKDSVPVIRK